MESARAETPLELAGERVAESPDDYIGERLRAERERQGIGLRRLAARLELSPSTLSQIETGRSRPSVSTLHAIVSELGMSFDVLFAPASGEGSVEPLDTGWPRAAAGTERVVRRAHERPVIELESGVRWERLNPTGDSDVDFIEVIYDVGGSSSRGGTFVHHPGREYGVVTSGTLKVTVGSEEYVLGPGDSICFESGVPHRLETLGDEPARAFWLNLGGRPPRRR